MAHRRAWRSCSTVITWAISRNTSTTGNSKLMPKATIISETSEMYFSEV